MEQSTAVLWEALAAYTNKHGLPFRIRQKKATFRYLRAILKSRVTNLRRPKKTPNAADSLQPSKQRDEDEDEDEYDVEQGYFVR